MSTQDPAGGRSDGYAYYVLVVFCVAYVFNYIDRSVISILLDPIKMDLHVSDTQMGLLGGFAFSLLYALASLPIARFADRHNRRNVIALGIAFWSAMAALCGAAQTYGQLFLTRMGVGVGEAAGIAPVHSTLTDYFAPGRRARTLGIYSASIYVGVIISMVLGGLLAERFNWRLAFIVTGLPGLLIAVLVRFSVDEPPRGRFDRSSSDLDSSLLHTWKFIGQQKSYLHVICGAALMAASIGGGLLWIPAFLGRVHGMSLASQGVSLGLTKGLGGITGALAGGWLTDRLVRRSVRWLLFVPALACLCSLPCMLVFLWAADLRVAFLGFVLGTTLAGMHLAPVFAAAQTLARPQMRALAASIVLVGTILAGQGFGPLLTGVLNDALAPVQHGLAVRTSLTLTAFFAVLAALAFLRGSRYVESDLARRDNNAAV